MELGRARNIAENLVKALGESSKACTRIEIAGSVRRGKPEVKDIELVAIPDPRQPIPVFGVREVFFTRLEQVLYNMGKAGVIQVVKGGEKYKQFWIMKDLVHLIKVDLFLVTPPSSWGVQFLLRTGPAEFSHWCVTQRHFGGALPDEFRVQDGAVWKGETPVKAEFRDPADRVEMAEEKDFLDFLGLGWIEPNQRVEKWAVRG